MKILITTASVGSGHLRAAEALFIEFKKRFPREEVKIVDFTDKNRAFLPWLLKTLYLRMLKYLPNLYDIFYNVSKGGNIGNLTGMMFSAITSPFMHKVLTAEKPDIIVATHPFPEGATAFLRHFNLWQKPLLAAVLTDYSLHNIWLYKNVDMYFVATETMKDELIKSGTTQIAYAYGIPIIEGERLSKEAAREKLNLNDDKTMLIMGGGLGLGGIEKSLKELENAKVRLNILVVTGQNEVLYERTRKIAENSKHNIMVFSYTEEIFTLMAASDLLITKPGALTMTEAFSMGLPMLLHEPIPGPEAKNALYAENLGASNWVHKNESILDKAQNILNNEEVYKKMSLAASSISKKNAAKKIVEVLSEFFQKNKR